MAFTGLTLISENHRGIIFQAKGDGASTSLTVTGAGYNGRTIATAPASKDTAKTLSYAVDGGTSASPLTTIKQNSTGMWEPTGGTAQAISSVTVNADHTITVVFSAAPTNAHIITVVVVWDQDRPSI